MKPSIQLGLSQQLKMTPQLQQAIKLLQLSALELQVEVQQALEANFMLEVDETQPDERTVGEGEIPLSDEVAVPAVNDINNEHEVQMATESMPDDLPVDAAWDDIYEPTIAHSSANGASGQDTDWLMRQSQDETLHDHLAWQLAMARFIPSDRLIAEAIIDDLNQDGYLSSCLQDVITALDMTEVDLADAEMVLHRIQHFDPPGIAARDLRECLLIQARLLPASFDEREHAIELLQHHFDLLAACDEVQLCRRLFVGQDELREILSLIRSLNPRPGASIADDSTRYIEPDVYVSKHAGRWRVELNANIMPRLRIHQGYANLVRRADTSRDNAMLKQHLQEARWLIKSLRSRNETILRVANTILEMQRDFFELGDEAMKPLVLKTVAEAVDMHESTISRVTMQKYMHTPRGVYEFKHFFSSHVGTVGGGEVSATAVRASIKKLIQSEPVKKPLSDNKIAALLADQGFKVARRTVAKYRESMMIPPSNERKRLL